MKRLLLCAVAVLAVSAGPLRADDMEDAAALVRNAVETVLGHLRDQGLALDAKREAIVKVIEPLFDFQLMGKLTLGERYWTALSPAEQEEFLGLFVQRLKNSYLDKIGLFTDGEVRYDPPQKAENKVYVTTHVVSKADDIKVTYKLYKKGGEGWRGYDFEIAGVSMVASYRSQYTQVLKDGSTKQLIEKMKEQAGADKKTP